MYVCKIMLASLYPSLSTLLDVRTLDMPRLFHLAYLGSVTQQLPAQGVSDLSALGFQKSIGPLQVLSWVQCGRMIYCFRWCFDAL